MHPIKERLKSDETHTNISFGISISLETVQNDTLEISYIGFVTCYWRAEAGKLQVIRMQEDTATQVHIHYYEPQERELKLINQK